MALVLGSSFYISPPSSLINFPVTNNTTNGSILSKNMIKVPEPYGASSFYFGFASSFTGTKHNFPLKQDGVFGSDF
jgi:hypothetical protein